MKHKCPRCGKAVKILSSETIDRTTTRLVIQCSSCDYKGFRINKHLEGVSLAEFLTEAKKLDDIE